MLVQVENRISLLLDYNFCHSQSKYPKPDYNSYDRARKYDNCEKVSISYTGYDTSYTSGNQQSCHYQRILFPRKNKCRCRQRNSADARPRCKPCLKDLHVTDNDCQKYT